ncbi:MAG: YitT family protein [Oscillospiraceae bacterium]|jgi:uncharacterized membrane-anchored protein YitT (DUF2179 family)|nr:YitT family protein [Oscillospiraceae bacterium]MCI1991433.1 YitT family protein [Oscillospiraceae bacterium]MCI2035847.1 YitT family protein [Oscillospiraceae bacterium]
MSPVQTAKEKTSDLIKDIAAYTAGSVLLALSITMFTAPNHIAPGGISGVSTMINYLTGWPIGTLSLLLNVPIFLWAFVEIGYKEVAKSLVATVLSSVTIDLLALVVQPYQGNPILASIFGGVLQGIALGMVFMRNATTGGTDMVARLLGRHVRFVSIGKLMLCVDGIVVIVSAFVYRSMENALYAIITIFVCSRLIDTILYGTDAGTGKVLFIVSSQSREIAHKILSSVDRGVTVLQSRGAYSGREGEVLLCAVRRYEVVKVKDIIHSVDPGAFLIVGEAVEITGEGFRPVEEEKPPAR